MAPLKLGCPQFPEHLNGMKGGGRGRPPLQIVWHPMANLIMADISFSITAQARIMKFNVLIEDKWPHKADRNSVTSYFRSAAKCY